MIRCREQAKGKSNLVNDGWCVTYSNYSELLFSQLIAGGFKSDEDYVYIRGRGKGKYVCQQCGIRCRKPSMLKKHIRTHTDLRPYSCKHCNFSFKTKGERYLFSKCQGCLDPHPYPKK